MSAEVDKKWIQLQDPKILSQTPQKPTKINHHQFIVTSRYRTPYDKENLDGIAIHDIHTNQWKLLAKYPTNDGYDTIGDTATCNMYKNKAYLTVSKEGNLSNYSHKLITFNLKSNQFEGNATIADDLWYSKNASVSVNKFIKIIIVHNQ